MACGLITSKGEPIRQNWLIGKSHGDRTIDNGLLVLGESRSMPVPQPPHTEYEAAMLLGFQHEGRRGFFQGTTSAKSPRSSDLSAQVLGETLHFVFAPCSFLSRPLLPGDCGGKKQSWTSWISIRPIPSYGVVAVSLQFVFFHARGWNGCRWIR